MNSFLVRFFCVKNGSWVFSSSLLQNKYAVKELYSVVAEKVADRPGGYTRILKTGFRLGDNAAMAMIELVDFNENMVKAAKKSAAAPKTRRSRRSNKKANETVEATSAE